MRKIVNYKKKGRCSMSETFNKKDLYKEINQHLESIDDSLKTLAWVQSATLSMNQENMKKLSDTTNKMISSFGALSQSDDNSEYDTNNDTNDVPNDVLVHDEDIKKEQDGE